MKNKTTLVIGASENPDRYSNMAIHNLRSMGHPVVAIGNREGQVGDVHFSKERKSFEDLDTITLYLSKKNQESYYDYILGLMPNRIIFNPGAENEELEKLAEEKGIEVKRACTLVMLRTGQY